MPEPIASPNSPALESKLGTLWRQPASAYVAPFVLLLFFLAIQDFLAGLGVWEAPLRFLVLGLVTLLVSRQVLDLRVSRPAPTVLLGLAVFVVWIAPDLLWPGFRAHWLFQNGVIGTGGNAPSQTLYGNAVFLVFRTLRAVVIVPVVEELFWRGWLMRWLIRHDFESAPMGAYTPASFWVCAVLFAAEHGSYWDVGLVAGIAYNVWMVRTKSLGDCILAHAVTNACLSGYVIWTGQWSYWP